jgi:hypothetical protein
MFSICIENSNNSGYHTEKIIDAFLSKTIPIYWGCSNIGDFYDTDGIIQVNNADEIIKVISDTIDMTDELSITLSNMFSNVNTKNFDDLKSKYNGMPSAEELLDEYKNDDDYELSEEMTNSKANIKPESI